jgi:hypothetical protein
MRHLSHSVTKERFFIWIRFNPSNSPNPAKEVQALFVGLDLVLLGWTDSAPVDLRMVWTVAADREELD